MIPEIGHFALILALLLALVQGVFPLYGAARGNAGLMGLARPVAQGQFVFVAIAFGALAYSFLNDDFSVLYVAEHSNSALPAHYRFTAVWGGHEGSILLWVMILNVWTTAVTVFSRKLPDDMIARVLGVMGLISVGFLLFILLTSNPFERLFPVPPDGQDLNPLLQDPGMVIHPPVLYMGYVGFSVAFSFAIAALLSGRLDAAWARWSRPWTTVAWSFLSFGIMLGSWWAYYTLGWGGWWFWDPVENASFMPWLVGTALIHSLAVTEKRGSFKSWTVLLAIFAFSMSLLGTFLVRSGVLTSVHAFASDPKRGVFILAFLVLVVGSSLTLFAWRAPKIGLGGSFKPVSRESFLLANNVLFSVAAATVLLGTLYPLVLDALNLGKISVGPPYFQSVFVPLMAPAVFLMGIGPFARWKEAKVPELAVRLKWAFGVSIVTGVLLPFTQNHWSPLAALGFVLVAWVVSTTVVNVLTRLRQYDGSLWSKLRRQTRSYYGMLLAHFGIAVFIVGVTMVKGYEVEQDVRMDIGDTTHVGGYDFRFDGVTQLPGPNYEAWRATLKVTKDGQDVTTMHPEKRIYRVQQNPMTVAAINTTVTRDLYAALGEPIDPNNPLGSWAVRIHLKPFVDWIWVGCILMGLGGLLAVLDRRYRIRVATSDTRKHAAQKPGTPGIGATGAATSRTALPELKP